MLSPHAFCHVTSLPLYYAVTPAFIKYYSKGSFPNSLIWAGACDSAHDEGASGISSNSMANAFLEKGAGSYLGYSQITNALFAKNTGDTFFEEFIGSSLTSGQSYDVTKSNMNCEGCRLYFAKHHKLEVAT